MLITTSTGPLYQGRFKSFPIQRDEHLLTAMRYVERNPLRANLVERAEQWRWSSLWQRVQTTGVPWLADWPIPLPAGWTRHANKPQTESAVRVLRTCVARGMPFGDEVWQTTTV